MSREAVPVPVWSIIISPDAFSGKDGKCDSPSACGKLTPQALLHKTYYLTVYLMKGWWKLSRSSYTVMTMHRSVHTVISVTEAQEIANSGLMLCDSYRDNFPCSRKYRSVASSSLGSTVDSSRNRHNLTSSIKGYHYTLRVIELRYSPVLKSIFDDRLQRPLRFVKFHPQAQGTGHAGNCAGDGACTPISPASTKFESISPFVVARDLIASLREVNPVESRAEGCRRAVLLSIVCRRIEVLHGCASQRIGR